MMQRSLHKPFALLPLVAMCAIFASSVQAQQAVVTIQGSLMSVSCTATVNGGNPVILPMAKQTDFPNVGNTTGITSFVVNVFGCNVNSGTVKAYFYANHVSGGRLNITSGGGSGWQYQLLPATGNNQLNVQTSSTPADNSVDPGANISGTSANITYRVRYYNSAGSMTPGNGNTTVNVALFYP